MRRLPIPLTLLSLLAACAHDEPVVDPASMPAEGRFVLTGIPRPVVALITEQGIQGPAHNLGRYDNGTTIRGKAYGKDVSITLADSTAEGIVGRSPFNMQVTRTPEGVTANGLIGGVPSTFTFSKAPHQRQPSAAAATTFASSATDTPGSAPAAGTSSRWASPCPPSSTGGGTSRWPRT